MLETEDCVLVVVDVQGKLAELMYAKDLLFRNIQILVESSKILNIPIVWTQQCPESLGETALPIAQLLENNKPINKSAFSCCGEEKFLKRLESLKRSQILLCGIEAHVCIYQTAVDLLNYNYFTAVAADAVSSRAPQNRQAAIDKMAKAGIDITTTEMAIFELLKTAQNPHFKDIAKLVK